MPAKDPSHPNLYYHPSPSLPNGTALSFLPSPPAKGSRTVLGHLPMGGGLEDFREEPQFLKLLHSSIKEALRLGKAQSVEFEAASRPSDGYITITGNFTLPLTTPGEKILEKRYGAILMPLVIDERAIPPAGRIGETEDLIGSVFVQEGKVVADTYDPLPTYRLVTANGPLILPQGLDRYLLEILERIDKEEKGDGGQ